jgi:hypothetical protein
MPTFKDTKVVDGNTAASYVAYNLCDVVYTSNTSPSSYMGEALKIWSAERHTNAYGNVTEARTLPESSIIGDCRFSIPCPDPLVQLLSFTPTL